MSKDRSKASLLSAQLDFEAIDGSETKNPEPALDFDVGTDTPATQAASPASKS